MGEEWRKRFKELPPRFIEFPFFYQTNTITNSFPEGDQKYGWSALVKNMGHFLCHLDLDVRKSTKKLDSHHLKIIKKRCVLVFNKSLF